LLRATSIRMYRGEDEPPFVDVQIVKGNSNAFEGEIAQRVMADISEHAGLPSEAVWVEGRARR